MQRIEVSSKLSLKLGIRFARAFCARSFKPKSTGRQISRTKLSLSACTISRRVYTTLPFRHLCGHLKATETLFPGTHPRVVYRLGSK